MVTLSFLKQYKHLFKPVKYWDGQVGSSGL